VIICLVTDAMTLASHRNSAKTRRLCKSIGD